ncbi:hypothetical protein HNP33_001772 [Comamonas odontotermitis]|uniref:Uncharacterized protein n=1 Tax=Comamonas odontotermitis TaxID=379895 RepID=A0ABR6REY2_9BURK|nr:hypothetical protein [Comamonas odontotermitis]MBB6577715.1 hypothetical protein [Comamonas odontotermitis]
MKKFWQVCLARLTGKTGIDCSIYGTMVAKSPPLSWPALCGRDAVQSAAFWILFAIENVASNALHSFATGVFIHFSEPPP